MKIIEKSEFDQLITKGRGRTTPIRSALLTLQPGQAVVIHKKDWKVKYTPFSIATQIERKHGVTFKKVSLADGSGWAIQRV
ncbi:MAG: hypothetical protein ABI723_26240 [Bacteroidia bacterium]